MCTSSIHTLISRTVQRGFQESRLRTPVILFLDELDVLGMNRKFSISEFQKINLIEINSCREIGIIPYLKDLNQYNIRTTDKKLGLRNLLIEIEKTSIGLIVFGITNRPKVLDPALTRSGRFYQTIFFSVLNMSY